MLVMCRKISINVSSYYNSKYPEQYYLNCMPKMWSLKTGPGVKISGKITFMKIHNSSSHVKGFEMFEQNIII